MKAYVFQSFTLPFRLYRWVSRGDTDVCWQEDVSVESICQRWAPSSSCHYRSSCGSLSKISGVWCPPFYIFIWFSIQNIWCLVSSVLYFHLVLYPKYLVFGVLRSIFSSGSLSKISGVWCPPFYIFIWFSIQNIWCLVSSVLYFHLVLYPKYLVLVLSALGLLVALYPKYLVFGVLPSIFPSGSLSKISGVWCPPFYIFIWFSIQNIWCWCSLL